MPTKSDARLSGELGLQSPSRALSDLKKVVFELTDELVDFSRTLKEQDTVVVNELERRIARTFPALLMDPTLGEAVRAKRMNAAMTYAQNRIYKERFARKNNNRLSQRTHASPSPPPPSNATKKAVKTPKLLQSQSQRPRVVPLSQPSTASRNLRSSGRGAANPPIRTSASVDNSDATSPPSYQSDIPSTAPPGYPGGAGNIWGARHPSPPPSTPSANRPPGTPTTSPTTTTTAKFSPLACRSHEVKEFLSACGPSMLSHLRSFLSFGCHNRDFLAAVATWSESDIEIFLNRVSDSALGSASGTGFTNMEILVLTQKFKVYFAV